MEESPFAEVLDAVYDAATCFEHWPVALERFGRVFGSGYVGLIDRNLRTMEGRAVAIGIDVAGQRQYFEHWSKHDILRQRTRAFRPGAVETDRDILPKSELLRSDYYNGFMKPHDMHGYMRMTLSIEDGSRKIISMSRPASLGDYEAADTERCRLFIPHFQRAARVTRLVEKSNLVLTAFSDVLEQSATGLILLGRTGKVVFANRASRAMAHAADSFLLRGERFEALIGKQDMALQRMIAGATGQMGRTDAARGGVMRLSRMTGEPDFAIAIAPLASGTSLAEDAAAAFVLVTDPQASPMSGDETMVRQLFGLSSAETRVAERLMMGDSPEQAAALLKIKTSTARWHLAALYRKTGTRRQSQLVRLLMSLPKI